MPLAMAVSRWSRHGCGVCASGQSTMPPAWSSRAGGGWYGGRLLVPNLDGAADSFDAVVFPRAAGKFGGTARDFFAVDPYLIIDYGDADDLAVVGDSTLERGAVVLTNGVDGNILARRLALGVAQREQRDGKGHYGANAGRGFHITLLFSSIGDRIPWVGQAHQRQLAYRGSRNRHMFCC